MNRILFCTGYIQTQIMIRKNNGTNGNNQASGNLAKRDANGKFVLLKQP